MATIIQGGPDKRYEALEQGVGAGVANFFAARKKKESQQKFVSALRAVQSAASYDDAVKSIAMADPEVLTNPDAMELLGEHIARKFPEQEAVTIDTPTGVQTAAVRKGDVAGAIAEAQTRGGRLGAETEVERRRASEDYAEELKAAQLKLEERRTVADEAKARASVMRANRPPKLTDKQLEVELTAQQMIRMGMPEQAAYDRASRIAFGQERIDIVTETGEARLSDVVSGRTQIVPVELLDTPETIPTPEPGKDLWTATLDGTGIPSTLREAASIPGAYMGIFAVDTTEARQRLKMSTQRLVRALANNERFPVAEQERIRKEMSLSPNVFVHPEVMRRRMITVHQELSLWQAQSERDGNDMNLPAKDRAAAKRDAQEIRNFLAELNVPKEQLEESVNPKVAMPPQAQNVFTPDEWQRLTPEERQQWLSQ